MQSIIDLRIYEHEGRVFDGSLQRFDSHSWRGCSQSHRALSIAYRRTRRRDSCWVVVTYVHTNDSFTRWLNSNHSGRSNCLRLNPWENHSLFLSLILTHVRKSMKKSSLRDGRARGHFFRFRCPDSAWSTIICLYAGSFSFHPTRRFGNQKTSMTFREKERERGKTTDHTRWRMRVSHLQRTVQIVMTGELFRIDSLRLSQLILHSNERNKHVNDSI